MEIKAERLHFLTNPLNDTQEILQGIFGNNLISTFSNVTLALRILLKLPVSVALGEESKNNKKRFGSIIQQKLTILPIISIKQKLLDNLNMHQIISQFADLKERIISFL